MSVTTWWPGCRQRAHAFGRADCRESKGLFERRNGFLETSCIWPLARIAGDFDDKFTDWLRVANAG